MTDHVDQVKGPDRRSFLKLSGAMAASGAVLLNAPGAAHAEEVAGRRRPKPPRHAPRDLGDGTRKFVEYGWDVPGPVFVRDNIRTMEQQPFNGVVFNIYENPSLAGQAGAVTLPNPLDPTPLTPADAQLDVLAAIDWQTFTDNFLITTVGRPPKTPLDWFDDTQWATLYANQQLLAQAVCAARGVGIFLDPENSAGNVAWQYNTTRFPNQTFAQVQAQVRRRGGQFVSALQEVKPDIKILILHLSILIRYLTPQYQAFLGSQLQDNPYALYLSFIDGMLDDLGPQATIIDGSETDYWFDETTLFVYDTEYQRGGWFAVSPENREKWGEIEIASTVYLDLVLGHAAPNIAAIYGCYKQFDQTDFQRWYEHNTYHAALKSSEYVWMYGEKSSWWTGAAFAGAADGLSAVAGLIAGGQPLGYDLSRYAAYPDNRGTSPVFVDAPTLVLSGPANGSQVPAGTAIVVTAATSDPTVAVERVEFYHNGLRIDYATTPPNIAAVFATPGPHTLLARAFLSGGGHVTSNPIIVQAV